MLNKFFKNRYFLLSMQLFMLFAFLLIIYGAIGITTNDKDFAIILRNTNLANLLVWSYWWPFIIVTAILFGRFWCSICPTELITSLFAKIGLKKKPGKILKSGWIITLFYAVILIIGIHTFSIHRIPRFMAFYMLILMAIAVVSGLIWEKRTFCTHICPIGHLLGLYSMLSFKQLRVVDKDVCNNCKTKDCISPANHYKLSGRSCTSELYPANLNDNRSCILCGQCHKSCTKDNIIIQSREIAADLFTDIKLSWAEIYFFMMVSGFVVYEVLSEWKVSKKILLALPDWINHSLGIQGYLSGTVKAITLFVIIPALFYLLLSLFKRLTVKETLYKSFSQLVIAMLPVTGSMHLLKALLKTTSRIPYWNYAFSDPQGVKAAEILMADPGLLNKHLLSLITPYVNIFVVLIPIAGLILSLLIINKQKYESRTSRKVSIFTVLFYFGIFFITLVSWRLL